MILIFFQGLYIFAWKILNQSPYAEIWAHQVVGFTLEGILSISTLCLWLLVQLLSKSNNFAITTMSILSVFIVVRVSSLGQN